MDTDKAKEAVRAAIGNEIRAARARKHLSQMELAERSGISHTTIVRLESGKRTVDVLQLFAICEALDVAPGALLDASQAAERAKKG